MSSPLLSSPLLSSRMSSRMSSLVRNVSFSRSPVTLTFLGLVDDALIGTMVAVSWSYILVQQIDPEGDCPSVATGAADKCRLLVFALFLNTVLGALYLPLASIAVIRVVARRTRKLLIKRSSVQRDSAKMSEVERSTLYQRRMDVAARIQHLLTTAASYSWSVSASCTVFYLLGQILSEASNGKLSSPTRPGIRGGGLFPPPADGGDADYGHCSRQAVSEDLAMVSGQIVAVSLLTSCLCVGVMLMACRMLRSPPTSPFRTEVLLLLSRFLYSALATSLVAIPSLFLFPCYELSLGTDAEQLLWAFVRALFLFFGGYFLSRLLAKGRDEKDTGNALILVLATSFVRCLRFMLISALAVVSCLGVHDFASTLISSSWVGLSDNGQIIAWFCYALVVVGFSAWRQHKRGVEKEVERALGDDLENDLEGDPGAEEHAASGDRFWDLFEAWLACFAFWVPWQEILNAVYTSLPDKMSGKYIDGESSGVVDHLLRFFFQVCVCVGMTVLCACLSLVIRPT